MSPRYVYEMRVQSKRWKSPYGYRAELPEGSWLGCRLESLMSFPDSVGWHAQPTPYRFLCRGIPVRPRSIQFPLSFPYTVFDRSSTNPDRAVFDLGDIDSLSASFETVTDPFTPRMTSTGFRKFVDQPVSGTIERRGRRLMQPSPFRPGCASLI